MNRRPNQSRTSYDSFSPRHTAHFTASSPSNDFFAPRKKKTLPRQLAFFVLLLLAAILSINFIVNQFVSVKSLSVPVKGLPSEFDGFTVLHISDLKGTSFGSSQQRLVFALGKHDYDAVVLTGDMLSEKDNAQPLYALIDARKKNAEK